MPPIPSIPGTRPGGAIWIPQGNRELLEILEELAKTLRIPKAYVERSEALFSKETIKENETSTWTNNTGKTVFLNIDLTIKSEAGRGESAHIAVGGVAVAKVLATENNGSYHLNSTFTVLVAPLEVVTISCLAGGGATQVEGIAAAYREM